MKIIEKIWHIIKILLVLGSFFLIYKGCESFENNGWRFRDNQNRTSQIFSLKTTSEVSGSFILGIGSIGGEDYYVFYRRTLSGGLIREKIRTSNCVLYEGYAQPKIIESGKIGYHLKDGDTISTSFSRDDYGSYHSIYIPKGTITEKINISIN